MVEPGELICPRSFLHVTRLAWVLIGLASCGGRALPYSGLEGAGGPVHDAGSTRADLQSFCSGPSTLVYEDTSYAVSRFQLSAMSTAMSPADRTTIFIAIEAAAPSGRAVKTLLSLAMSQKSTDGSRLDLGHLPDGITFAVSSPPADPYFPVLGPRNTYEGHIALKPTAASPGYDLHVCLSARLQAYEDLDAKKEHMASLRAWVTGTARLTACAGKYDWLCNDYMGAAIVGTCNDDGTCTCVPGHARSASTGRCML